MSTTTSPDNIFVLETSDNDTPSSWQPAMATSVQNALNLRALQTFRWANATERGAQTGMVSGDVGFQQDSKDYFWFDGTDWQLSDLDQTLVISDTATVALTGTATKIDVWGTVDRQVGGAPSLVSGTFTATKAGWYETSAYLEHVAGSGAINGQLDIRKNGVMISRTVGPATNSSLGLTSSTATGAYLAVGDTLEVWAARSTGNSGARRWTIRRVGS